MKINSLAPKSDFPIFQKKIAGLPLVYLDSAATSQKPLSVIQAISDYYTQNCANTHRGVHTMSDLSTQAWEESRKTIADFFGAKNTELIVVQNATQATNAVAYGWGEHNIESNDVILSTVLEHHANFVVWQELCKRKNAIFKTVAVTQDGSLDLLDFKKNLDKYADRVKLICFTHVSNATGAVSDIDFLLETIKASKAGRARILVDGAQSAGHLEVNFARMGVDFYCASAHKMLGPMGIGALFVREKLLIDQEMRPWLFGGGMIGEVYLDKTVYHHDLIERFTAGTPDVASLVGFAKACEYLNKLGMKNVVDHDLELLSYAWEKLSKNKLVRLLGPTPHNLSEKLAKTSQHLPTRMGSITFMMKGAHAHDIAQILDSLGVAVRSGHHCTMPLHTQQDWLATVRASFYVYSDCDDVDALIEGLQKVEKILAI